jgi:hypothetical protein
MLVPTRREVGGLGEGVVGHEWSLGSRQVEENELGFCCKEGNCAALILPGADYC